MCVPTSMTARSIRSLAILAVVISLAAACAPGDADAPDEESGAEVTEAADLPAWLGRIYPRDDQVVATAADVQVEHDVLDPDEQIRLLVDEVDVTTYALEGRGELVYDRDRELPPADQGAGGAEDPAEDADEADGAGVEAPVAGGPVELSPGTHQATVQRLRVDPESGSVEETLDEFSWDFTVQ